MRKKVTTSDGFTSIDLYGASVQAKAGEDQARLYPGEGAGVTAGADGA